MTTTSGNRFPGAARRDAAAGGRAARRREAAFTLIEVMVALAIISLSLAGIAVTMGGMLDNAVELRERTYASWIAQNRIVEIRAAGTTPDAGETSGEVEYANGEWAWVAVVSETGIENLWRIDVSVSRPGEESVIRTVTGFAGEPVIPGQANRLWIAGSSGTGQSQQPAGATN